MNEQQKQLLTVYPGYEELIESYCNGYFDNIEGVSSARIMDGDIVRCSQGVCVVEIQGESGGYAHVQGKYRNITIRNEGFLRSLETGEAVRSSWRTLRVLKRAVIDA